ncbi:AMP-binding protein [Roseateles cellulosilyticus]|uniref:Long-chain-fatty-acid--CoA ligase n=1 Tax=Pelomonas cellulosilytica TaxID=2906762 RepID=A0ABS8Y124_9BURK|nr:AMP-binding protein [Pelomonas sp. P8]MCE4557275.1 AMP-binding protein [Pelomonas sp. P8]
MTAVLAEAAPEAPSCARPWLTSYPAGVPAGVEPTSCPHLVELLEAAFRRHANRDAAVCMGQRLSFADLDRLSARLGAWLQAQGLKPGDRVALMMPNMLQYSIAVAAVLRAGFVVVGVNPAYTPRELAHQLKDSGARALIVLENFARTVADVIDATEVRHVILTSVGDLLGWWKGSLANFARRHVSKQVPEFRLPTGDGRTVVRFNEALRHGERLPLRKPALRPDDVAFLQYTGGTTGVSKGATLLHRNVAANVLQIEAWFRPMLARLPDPHAPLTTVCVLPLHHVFALTACLLLGARMGHLNLLVPDAGDVPGLVDTLRGHKLHIFPGAEAIFGALLQTPGFHRLDFSELAITSGGGMALQPATAERWLQATGCPIVEGYGLSETSPAVAINPLDPREFNGSVGLPLPSTEISIRDDDGQQLPAGEPGEICVRGPQVMAGYWRRPEETAQALWHDGFFKTGDIGVMDERGFVRLVDRKKDLILVGGLHVYPSEVEQVAGQHPGVLACAAVGVPEPRGGEAVKLFVVRRDAALDEDALARHCARQLAAYKRPRFIEFCAELPRNGVGKILRRELRALDA